LRKTKLEELGSSRLPPNSEAPKHRPSFLLNTHFSLCRNPLSPR
jgi:hypothetical protein